MYHHERDPLAIIGIGCRLPGHVESLGALLDLLLAGESGIVPIPESRWDRSLFYHPDPHKRGHMHVTRGGFIDGIEFFDPALFDLSPHEARRMDPQQRLVLETAFRAIEDAQIPVERLAGTDTAVVVGASGRDYDAIQGGVTERHQITGTTNTGSASSIVANRVSYVFDLRGPSFAVDTACSSALYALHAVCRSIWTGEASLGLAGGVNAILKPEPTIGFSTGGYLSPDAECRAFSDHANGYVRGEGAAMVLVKPLSTAMADGDRIHAVIHGSWVNQDGRSLAMTAPSEDAQVTMLRRAYRDAGVDPHAVHYVEAHGTGTPVGDPTEARALGRVLGKGRASDKALLIGSVKTNIGHLESAAGMAGLLKLVLTLKHRLVFPNRNFRAPNAEIPFEALGLRVPTVPIPLPPHGALYGGVNSFGFGGANAHVVIGSAPSASESPRREMSSRTADVLMLSARSREALTHMAAALAEKLDQPEVDLETVIAALANRRSTYEFRLAAQVRSPADGATRLRAYVEDSEHCEAVATGHVSAGAAKPVAFVFSGQGAQWAAMGRTLLQCSDPFRRVLTRVDRELTRLGWLAREGSSLFAELNKDEERSRMGETEIAQPALFAVQMGLVAELAARGIHPAAVIGHSIGELAAAATAGALTFEQATRIVYWRSRSQAIAEGRGRMIAVGLSASKVQSLLSPYRGRLELAAVNGPDSVTIAGEIEAANELLVEFERQEIFARPLNVSVPFHCFLMDPVEPGFRAGVGQVASSTSAIPSYSTVSGGRLPGEDLGLDYWYANIREPVLFHDGLCAMVRDGYELFVEIGPHPILKRGGDRTLHEQGLQTSLYPTLQRQRNDSEALAETIARLFVDGAVRSQSSTSHVDGLPLHPFERQPIWLETARGRALRRLRPAHPTVAEPDHAVENDHVFRCQLHFDVVEERYLAEHVVQGVIVVPGAAQLEAVLAAATGIFGPRIVLDDIRFERPIVLPNDGDAPEVRLEVRTDEGHFVIASRNDVAVPWSVHTRGRINHAGDRFEPDVPQEDAVLDARSIEPTSMFNAAARAGLELGPSFRGITSFRVTDTETWTEIVVPEVLQSEALRYLIHPALLDSIIQTAAFGPLSGALEGEDPGLFLPQGVGRIGWFGPATGRLRCCARLVKRAADELVMNVRAMDESGTLVVALDSLAVRFVEGTRKDPVRRLEAFSYALCWQAETADESPLLPDAAPWVVLTDECIGPLLVEVLREQGQSVVEVARSEQFARLAPWAWIAA